MARLLNRNNGAKVLAFFMALLLWLHVTGETLPADNAEVIRPFSNVPLSWRNLDERMQLSEIPAEIDIVLRGAAVAIEGMAPDELEVFVDLRGLGEGQHRLTPNAVVPRGVSVISYRPQQVVVLLTETIVQQKPVSLEIKGQPAAGLVMGEARLNPGYIFVHGTRALLPKVYQVKASVDVSDTAADFRQLVEVQPLDEAGETVRGVTLNPPQIEVLVPVSKPRREVPVRVQLEGEPARGFQIRQVNVTPETVMLQGLENELKRLAEVLTLPVSVAGATANIVKEISITVPDTVEVTGSGKVVTVEVIIEPR
ncbi:MAG: CdaA regulatory protein CdaR [Syntrophomonadaceae bacterium]|nr:CdaA regulatory protein CdaR [Bacillota bacterium]